MNEKDTFGYTRPEPKHVLTGPRNKQQELFRQGYNFVVRGESHNICHYASYTPDRLEILLDELDNWTDTDEAFQINGSIAKWMKIHSGDVSLFPRFGEVPTNGWLKDVIIFPTLVAWWNRARIHEFEFDIRSASQLLLTYSGDGWFTAKILLSDGKTEKVFYHRPKLGWSPVIEVGDPDEHDEG